MLAEKTSSRRLELFQLTENRNEIHEPLVVESMLTYYSSMLRARRLNSFSLWSVTGDPKQPCELT